MQLIIMRHGQTVANLNRTYSGISEVQLTAYGRQQARKAGIHPHISHVYTSTLSRAQETARICFPCAKQTAVAGLEEMDFGVFAGRSADDMIHDAAYRAWVDGACTGRCPGGESRDEFIERVAKAFTRVINMAKDREEERPIIVAHGGTIMAVMTSYVHAEEARPYFDWAVGNCQGYTARVKLIDEKPRLSHCTLFENLNLLDTLG